MSAPLALPENPNLDWLRKQSKRRLDQLRAADPRARLAEAQRDIARRYGFSSWRALKAHIESLTIDGRLFAAARDGDFDTISTLLDAHPDRLHARLQPYEWSLLHVAAHGGRLEVVDLLLQRGLDANVREAGDNTYALHWAAAAGHLGVVARLVEAGADVVGRGDDHELEVIGWATCWDGANDAAHRAVAEFLVSRGARHHIFSAVALGLEDVVRGIVAADPSALNARQSRHENHRTPLHFAAARQQTAMIALLLELGADPLAVDGSGQPVLAYATDPDSDRAVLERIHAMTAAELRSADRGHRTPRGGPLDLVAALGLRDWVAAETLVSHNQDLLQSSAGVLHLMAKRGDIPAIGWLLQHGANPNGLWPHWDADVTPLHLAAAQGHLEAARALLSAGADPSIRDSKHESDAIGWAEHFRQPSMVELLASKTRSSP